MCRVTTRRSLPHTVARVGLALSVSIALLGCNPQSTRPSPPPADVSLEAGPDGNMTVARSAALQDIRPVIQKLIKAGTITNLHLYDCDFENGALADLPRVESLELLELRRATRIGSTSIPQTPFKKLHTVRFERMECSADTVRFLTQAPQLKRLIICYSQMDRLLLEQVRQLASIDEVNLHHSSLSPQGWEAIEGASWRSLILDDVAADAGLLQSLAKLPQLERLSLVRSNVTSSWEQLKELRACKWIDLTGCAVDDTAALQWENMPKLEVLQLHQTKVSPDAKKSLQSRLPQCRILDDTTTQTDYTRKSLSNL